MRKILFSLVALLALLLAVEVGVTLLSQHGMERALRSQYDLPSDLETNISSFPYLLSLARNHINEVRLAWRGELPYQAAEGSIENMPYEGVVSLCDVELNVPSLLRGKLEIRHVSRQKAAIWLEVEGLTGAYGMSEGEMSVENGSIYVVSASGKTKYRVKVTGDDTLSLEPYETSMTGTGLYSNPDYGVKTVTFHALPLGAVLLNASVSGGRVLVEISIPMWEGYL